ncbi:hypothetical protein OG365_18470 [Streptomyces sp. NBC_00853]|uniref:hypothetical protein n=1 Tax=Streptomyces sp. NBC_00853 TaxID=2903681 RepID=UPI003873B719|nr:hypothetical protein OG365_18470 [Streptomyces sp. NBC_00853]
MADRDFRRDLIYPLIVALAAAALTWGLGTISGQSEHVDIARAVVSQIEQGLIPCLG